MMFFAGRDKGRRTPRIVRVGREDPLPVRRLKGLVVPLERASLQSSERDDSPPIVVPDDAGAPPFEPFRFPG